MACTVYVYDDLMQAVNSQYIEILETDHWGVKIDRKMNTQISPNVYGVQLKAPAPAQPINVWVDDTHRNFAPTSLGYLHGRVPARLDVTLYPMTTKRAGGSGGSGGGGAPQPVRQIAAFIFGQAASGNWSEPEASGVRRLVETVTRAFNSPRLDSDMQARLDRWYGWLMELGIRI